MFFPEITVSKNLIFELTHVTQIFGFCYFSLQNAITHAFFLYSNIQIPGLTL